MTFKPKLGNSLGSTLADQQRQSTTLQKTTAEEKREKPTFDDPEKSTEKLRIIFDDSGSMGEIKIRDARDGCIEFLRNCKLNETAVAVHVMSPQSQQGLVDLISLTTNLPALSVLIAKIQSVGTTPLFETLKNAQSTIPKATRFIVFSDGAPDSIDVEDYKERTIQTAIKNKTPVDTVLITISRKYSSSWDVSLESQREYILLKELADRTGGYFLVFDRNKVDFKTAFKYLAPSLRGKLSDGKVRLALQAGELK